MKYSLRELDSFKTFYAKYQCTDCSKCQYEAVEAFQDIGRFFTERDKSALGRAWARAKVNGRSELKRLMLTIYTRLDVPLTMLGDHSDCQ